VKEESYSKKIIENKLKALDERAKLLQCKRKPIICPHCNKEITKDELEN
jgi:hypothetical protein